jgi:hypothetical protein
MATEKPVYFTQQIRTAIADYMQSEGCSCCRDSAAHEKHTKVLAKLLRVPKYKDGSGYDFSKYKTKYKTKYKP